MRQTWFYIFLIFQLAVYSQGYKHYSIDQGLPSKRVYKIIQDKEGFIWIATDKGVAKFDGDDFKVFTVKDGLPSNDIWDIVETSDGKIWYMTKAPRMGYIYKDKVYQFPFEGRNDVIYPHFMTDRKEILYDDINTGLKYQLNDSIWITVSDTNFFPVLHPKVKGFKRESGKWKIIKHDGTEFLIEEKVNVWHVNQVNDSLIFVIYVARDLPKEEFRIIWYNMNDDYWYERPHSLNENQIKQARVIATDWDVQLTADNYWAELGPDLSYKNHLKLKDFPYQWRAFRDKEGNFWVYTYNNGVFFFRNSMLHSQIHFKNKQIRFLKTTGLGITVSVLGEGIFYYDTIRKSFKPFLKTKNFIHDIYIKNKDHYIISGERYFRLALPGKNTITLPYTNFKIFKKGNKFYLLKTSEIAINDSLFRPLHKFTLTGQELLTGFQNRIIVGGSSGLYEIIHDTTARPLYPDSFNKPILSMANAGKYLYIGTDGYGLFRWDGKHEPELVEYNRAPIVNDILYEKDKLWIATQEGVKTYFVKNDTLKFANMLRHYDGLPSDQIIDVEMQNGKLFSAAYSGISVTDTISPSKKSIHQIYFKKIIYNNKNIPSNHQVKFKKNEALHVSFGVIDFSGQEHNRYFYRLMPLQEKWKEIPNKSITLGNIGPGEYNFEIKVINPYGQSLENTYRFQITPLWWQTAWAKGGFFFLFLSSLFIIIYSVRRYEIRKNVKEIEHQKQLAEFELHALRSQMNPHFVFNSLNAIQYYISDENYDKSESYLVKFSRLIRMIFDFTRKKTLPLKDEIKLLKSYLTLEKMRFGDKLTFEFKIDPALQVETTHIPTMLLQPIVENAVNHGIFHKKSPGKIVLEFKKTGPQSMEITISDDGVGIKKAEEIKKKSLRKHLSKATEILKERIKLLNVSGKWKVDYKIEDLTGTDDEFSTRVTLKIKKL